MASKSFIGVAPRLFIPAGSVICTKALSPWGIRPGHTSTRPPTLPRPSCRSIAQPGSAGVLGTPGRRSNPAAPTVRGAKLVAVLLGHGRACPGYPDNQRTVPPALCPPIDIAGTSLAMTNWLPRVLPLLPTTARPVKCMKNFNKLRNLASGRKSTLFKIIQSSTVTARLAVNAGALVGFP